MPVSLIRSASCVSVLARTWFSILGETTVAEAANARSIGAAGRGKTMRTRKSSKLDLKPGFPKLTKLVAWAAALYMLGLALSAAANHHKATIITFDAPGAVSTMPTDINLVGAITGLYFDSSNVVHGFLRARDGEFTTFVDRGACRSCDNLGTGALSINLVGAVTGAYTDANNVNHGFVRASDGRLINFDAPHAGRGANQGTWGFGINNAGEIAGDYQDTNNVYHGFVRAPDGTIITFDAPHAGAGANQGTGSNYPACLNPAGAITGLYTDANGVLHGYVRGPKGAVTEFDAPQAGADPGQGTVAYAINLAGTITGWYIDWDSVSHGFVRAPDGPITTFDAPGAVLTESVGIDLAGAIAGDYLDASNVWHGFVRAPDGTITPFDVSGAGAEDGQGTIPYAINPEGEITGFYVDSSNVAHGFLRQP